MHASGHHFLPRLQARGDHDLVAVHRAHLHGLRTHRHGGFIQHPDGGPGAFLAQGAGGQLDGRNLCALDAASLHIDRGAQWQLLGRVQRQLDRERARHRVGAGAHLAHMALEHLTGAGQHRLHGLTRFERHHGLLRHGEHRITWAVMCQSDHRLACRDNLPHFGLHPGHHTAGRGLQSGIRRLIGLRLSLRAGLRQAGIGRLERGFAALQFDAADEVLSPQSLKAAQLGLAQVTLGLRSSQLRLGGLRGQLVILRVDLGQHLARLHALTGFGLALRQLARDPKAQDEISASSYFASLKSAIERRAESVKVITKAKVDLQVPLEVAIGLAEATFQALGNSLEHAPTATKREASMSSNRDGIKLVLVDNGPGFRMSRVPRNRMGVRLTIFKRLETLGVEVNLKSSPGEGTTWVFEWRAK